ncbi:MAG: helix-turn-helix domain-containing protein [Bradyrhizobium sp.]|nr:helix-turn-helix domain-containing protein [Bradyrhizobium sp.]
MNNDKLALSVADVVQIAGLGRTTVYAEIKAGRLIARKIGRRTFILREDFDSWLRAQPTLKPPKMRSQGHGEA